MIFQPNLIVNIVEPTSNSIRYGTSLPYTTHYIGNSKHPLTMPGNSTLFLAHYSSEDEPFSGPVKKITFNQLGSCETPNMAPYTNTCEALEFNGYINAPRTCFEVASQLPKVTDVDIFIGTAQQHGCLNEGSKYFPKTPVCPRVKTLKIVMDLEYFHSFQHYCTCGMSQSQCNKFGHCLSDIQRSLIFLAESLLKHAGDSFPNLKTLIVDLPENDRLYKAVQSLIKVCRDLRQKTQTTLENIIPGKKVLEVVPEESIHSHSSSWQSNEPTPGSNPIVSAVCSNRLLPAYSAFHEDVYDDSQSSEHETISPTSEFSSNSSILTSHEFNPMIIHRPPPGFAPIQARMQGLHVERSEFRETDVGQRVNNWLKSVENN